MAQIRNELKERLSTILSLLSPMKYVGITFRLNPTIDYHKVMEKYEYVNTTISGLTTTTIYPDINEEIQIINGHMRIQCDANVANRKPTAYAENDRAGTVYKLYDIVTDVCVANDDFYFWLVDNNINDWFQHEGNGASSLYKSLHTCPPLLYPNRLIFDIASGVAGDSLDIRVTVKISQKIHIEGK